MSAIGFKRPGLECEHCHELFALSLSRPDVKKPADLPDPFQATWGRRPLIHDPPSESSRRQAPHNWILAENRYGINSCLT